MPAAPVVLCGGCGRLTKSGTACPSCAEELSHHRGSAASRGYDRIWRNFRRRFIEQLVEHGLVPRCGATLPTGPRTADSACLQAGLYVLDHLHLDHEPPLTKAERDFPDIVCDGNRIQLLCRTCHARKTERQTGRKARRRNSQAASSQAAARFQPAASSLASRKFPGRKFQTGRKLPRPPPTP